MSPIPSPAIVSSIGRCSAANVPLIAIGRMANVPSSSTSHVRLTMILRKTTTHTSCIASTSARRIVCSVSERP